MTVSSFIFFSIEAMQRKFIIVLPSKQRLYKIAFSAGTGLSETLLGRRKRRTRIKLLYPSTDFKITIMIVNLAKKKKGH